MVMLDRSCDHTVRDDVHRSVVAAKDDRPQADRFDETGLAIDRDDVAEADLVLQDQEETCDHIADKILCSESHCETGDPGAGQDRADVDVEQRKRHQRGDADDEQRGDNAQQLTERGDALPAFEQVRLAAVARDEKDLKAVDQKVRGPRDEIRAGGDDDQAQTRAHQPRHHLFSGDSGSPPHADPAQHDETRDEESDEPERRTNEAGEAFGELGSLVEHAVALESGGKAVDRSSREAQHGPDEQGGRQSSGYSRKQCREVHRVGHTGRALDTV